MADSFDMLRVVLTAEADARGRVEAAQRESEELLRRTDEECRRAVRAAAESRDAVRRAAAARLVEEAEEKVRAMTEAANARAAAMRARAEGRMEDAVAAVLRCLFSTDGYPRRDP